MEYLTKNHSKYLLQYHIIFVVKYRLKIIDQFPIKDICSQLSINDNYIIKVMEVDKAMFQSRHYRNILMSKVKSEPLNKFSGFNFLYKIRRIIMNFKNVGMLFVNLVKKPVLNLLIKYLNTDTFRSTLADKINERVDIPNMTEEQEKQFFELGVQASFEEVKKLIEKF